MAERKTRECLVCHRKYQFCPHCDEDHNKPLWMVSFCSDNCMTIIETATSYNRGDMSIEDAYNIISKCDLSGRSGWTKSVTKDIDAILAYDKKKESVDDSGAEKPAVSEKPNKSKSKKINYGNSGFKR